MLGPQVGRQDRLFYEFCLEDRVPPDHLLRKIDAVLDLSWLRQGLNPCYSHTGRPSVDPKLMIRMLLVGYCYSIRSERRLCQEVELNLAYHSKAKPPKGWPAEVPSPRGRLRGLRLEVAVLPQGPCEKSSALHP